MRSWYDFGYDGFPTGERRRRFYRQRDDPCDSEEEFDYDDDTNDRPEYYYPIRERDSSETEATEAKSDSFGWEDLDDKGSMGLLGAASLPAFVHTTVREDEASWYGCSLAVFPICEKHNNCYALSYGGIATATRQASGDFRLMEFSRERAHLGPFACSREGKLTYRLIGEDSSISSRFNWSMLHNDLDDSNIDQAGFPSPIPRFGHCSCSVETGSSEVGQLLARHTEVSGRSQSLFSCPPSHEYELLLSLVVGGARAAVKQDSAHHDKSLLHHLRVQSQDFLPPALCMTAIYRSRDHSSQVSHWTGHLPLYGAGAPLLMFASLTPFLTMHPQDHLFSYALLGGTKNGCTPIPSFELQVIALHVGWRTWTSSTVLTFGSEPPPRFGHTTEKIDDHLLVFGGIGTQGQYLSDFHILNIHSSVWRQVFIPLRARIPARAFHCTTMIRCSIHSHRVGNGTLSNSLNQCANNESSQDNCLTARETGCALVVMGGECNGVAEPSVWSCSLDSNVWRRWEFPQSRSFSTFSAESPSGPRSPLSPLRLSQVTASLCEKEAAQSAQTTHDLPDSFYVSACHGSLPFAFSALTIFGEGNLSWDSVGDEVVLVGGSRSPPISFASHLIPTDGSLNQWSLFWLLSARMTLFGDVLQRVPTRFRRFFPAVTVPDACVRTGSCIDADENHEQSGLSSIHQLSNDSVVQEELRRWMSAARKRLKPGATLPH